MSTPLSVSQATADHAAAVLQTVQALGQNGPAGGQSSQQTARAALYALGAFAAPQLHLFQAGFTDQSPLTPDPRFTADYLVEATTQQIAYDADVLLRALGQRAPGTTTPAMRAALDRADRLAAAALAPAVSQGLVGATAVLTYFQKSPTIRLVPYAPLALIGFDLGAAQDPLQFLAIGHEVGHHVYRHMMAHAPDDLDAQLQTAGSAAQVIAWPSWLERWQEEAFADVYAALIGGPAAALMIQQIQAPILPAQLTVDDGDHPLAALRPYLYVDALRAIAAAADESWRSDLLRAAAALEQRWQEYLVSVGAPAAFVPADGSAAVALTDAREALSRCAAAVLGGVLAALAPAVRPWSRGLAVGGVDRLGDLAAQFEAFLRDLPETLAPALQVVDSGGSLVVEPRLTGAAAGRQAVGSLAEGRLHALRSDALAGRRRLTPDEWKAVFLAGDWLTEEGGSGITPVRRFYWLTQPWSPWFGPR